MSTVSTGSPICPGQKELLEDGRDTYLRVMVWVVYNDGPANVDFFYLHRFPMWPTNATTTKALTDEVAARLRLHQGVTRINRVDYMGYYAWQMTPEEVAAADYRFIEGSGKPYNPPAPTPAPAPIPPAAAPVPSNDPPPTPAAPTESIVADEPVESVTSVQNAGSERR